MIIDLKSMDNVPSELFLYIFTGRNRKQMRKLLSGLLTFIYQKQAQGKLVDILSELRAIKEDLDVNGD